MKVTRIPTYPYTLHLPVKADVKANARIPKSDHRRLRVFKRSDLRAFRSSLDLAAGLARMSDQVATFAIGGLAPMQYILERFGAYGERAKDHSLFAAKFHVFGGLNWPGSGSQNKDAFLAWLESHEEGKQVLLIDTGRDGNAAGQLFNFIEERFETLNPITIQILVVGELDRARRDSDHQSKEFQVQKGTIYLTKDVVRVPDTATEDALYLAGYTKSAEGLGLNPINVLADFKVELEDGKIAMVESGTTGQAFMNLLLGKLDLLSVL